MLSLQDPWAHPDALRGRRVLLAMSGGVDSSAAATVLQSRGARVTGLTMKNFCYSDAGAGATSCCSVTHLHDARRVCDQLGIEHHVVDTSQLFEPLVIDRFVAEYEAGRTPNPCVDCNRDVRFPELLRLARLLDSELLATGHYARVGRDASGAHFVRRAAYLPKDQSYFLHGITAECLSRTVFPLGDHDKEAARAAAREAQLPVADKPESQEVCFIPDGDRAGFLAARTQPRPGRIADLAGKTVGGHDGIGRFTVGQRRGLGLGGGHTWYVHHIEPATQTVVVADAAALRIQALEVDAFWLRVDAARDDIHVQVRYRHAAALVACIEMAGAQARLRLAEPVSAVAPGQAAVLYVGDAVVGGGRIVATAA